MKGTWKKYTALFLAVAMILVSGVVLTNEGFKADSVHEHTDECYETSYVADLENLICGMEEHMHSVEDGCYEMTTTLNPIPGTGTYNEETGDWEGVEYEEVPEPVYDDNWNMILICDKPEHYHIEAVGGGVDTNNQPVPCCYGLKEVKTLICGKDEGSSEDLGDELGEEPEEENNDEYVTYTFRSYCRDFDSYEYFELKDYEYKGTVKRTGGNFEEGDIITSVIEDDDYYYFMDDISKNDEGRIEAGDYSRFVGTLHFQPYATKDIIIPEWEMTEPFAFTTQMLISGLDIITSESEGTTSVITAENLNGAILYNRIPKEKVEEPKTSKVTVHHNYVIQDMEGYENNTIKASGSFDDTYASIIDESGVFTSPVIPYGSTGTITLDGVEYYVQIKDARVGTYNGEAQGALTLEKNSDIENSGEGIENDIYGNSDEFLGINGITELEEEYEMTIEYLLFEMPKESDSEEPAPEQPAPEKPAKTNFTVKYVDKNGKEIMDSIEFLGYDVGSTFTKAEVEAEKDGWFLIKEHSKNGIKYTYTGNFDSITLGEDAAQNVVTLVYDSEEMKVPEYKVIINHFVNVGDGLYENVNTKEEVIKKGHGGVYSTDTIKIDGVEAKITQIIMNYNQWLSFDEGATNMTFIQDGNVEQDIIYDVYFESNKAPEKDSNVIKPEIPITPVTPNTPETPETPETPVVPNTPATPNTPVTPVRPTTPVVPTAPVAPIVPTEETADVTEEVPTPVETPEDVEVIAPVETPEAAAPVIEVVPVNATPAEIAPETPAVEISVDENGNLVLTAVDDIDLALANQDLGHICNILYFIMLLCTTVALATYYRSAKKHNERIFELRRELGEDDPYRKN